MRRFMYVMILSLLCVVSVVMAAEECPTLVKNALELAYDSCTGTERNSACYGNQSITITPRPNVRLAEFAQPGDVAPLAALEQIELGSQIDADEWGIALLQLQADLPDTTPGQNVTMVLFGAVNLENAVPPLTEFPATTLKITAVRSTPDTEANNIIAFIAPDTVLNASGRDEDRAWVRVTVPEEGVEYTAGITAKSRRTAWLQSAALASTTDLAGLPVVPPAEPAYTPMQAFYFSTGIGDRPCAEAPDSGILVQTPEGSGTLTLNANGVEIELGSTAYLQSANGIMRISVIEGSALVTANRITQTVPAGAFIEIPLTPDGRSPSQEPGVPQPYDAAPLQTLPVTALPAVIAVAPPADAALLGGAALDPALTYHAIFSYVITNDCADWVNIDDRYDFDTEFVFNATGDTLYTGRFIYYRAGAGIYTAQDVSGPPENQTVWNYTMRLTPAGMIDGELVATWNVSNCGVRYVIDGTYSTTP